MANIAQSRKKAGNSPAMFNTCTSVEEKIYKQTIE